MHFITWSEIFFGKSLMRPVQQSTLYIKVFPKRILDSEINDFIKKMKKIFLLPSFKEDYKENRLWPSLNAFEVISVVNLTMVM